MVRPDTGQKQSTTSRTEPDEVDMTHALSKENSMEIKGKWVPAIPYPLFVTAGLPFWKRWNEKNWRSQCDCGRIFDTLEDYYAHIIYKNSPYGSLK